VATGFDPAYSRARPAWHDEPVEDTSVDAATLETWDQAIYDLKRDSSHVVAATPVWAGIITPSNITANVNDYSPANLATSRLLRVTTTADFTMSGMATGVAGREVEIVNIGAFKLTLLAENAGSSANNRFSFATDYILLPKQGIKLEYDGVSNRWRVIATTSYAGRAPLDAPDFTTSVSLAGTKLITVVTSADFDCAGSYDFAPPSPGGIWVCQIEKSGTGEVLCGAIYGVGYSTAGGGVLDIAALGASANVQPGGYFASTAFTIVSNNSATAKIRASGNAATGINIKAVFRRMSAIL
jgi:hypothetical protein